MTTADPAVPAQTRNLALTALVIIAAILIAAGGIIVIIATNNLPQDQSGAGFSTALGLNTYGPSAADAAVSADYGWMWAGIITGGLGVLLMGARLIIAAARS